MIPLLLGIFIAAIIFGSLLWCGYRAYLTSGVSRLAHIGVVAFTVGVMVAITYQTKLPGQAIGALLAASSLTAVLFNVGWERLLPLTLAALGFFCLIGGPFG